MKLLIIDDSSMSRKLLKRILGEEYTFIEAADGMSGLEAFYLEKPEVVILDLTMPGMSGLDALEKIMAIDPSARILIGTADLQAYTLQLAKERGALGILPKPYTAETSQELARLLGSQNQARNTGEE